MVCNGVITRLQGFRTRGLGIGGAPELRQGFGGGPAPNGAGGALPPGWEQARSATHAWLRVQHCSALSFLMFPSSQGLQCSVLYSFCIYFFCLALSLSLCLTLCCSLIFYTYPKKRTKVGALPQKAEPVFAKGFCRCSFVLSWSVFR